MNYFLDTEFAETGGSDSPTIDLISIGIVAEDGREYYGESSDFIPSNCNPWVVENVLPHLGPREERKPRSLIREDIMSFIGGDSLPKFWGYYADYDWVVFCWLFGNMVDLPPKFPRFCMDLRQWLGQLGDPDIKPPAPKDEHHALADARWNLSLYEDLLAYSRKKWAGVL